MTTSRSLLKLKAAQLKHLAICTGLPTVGTKAELESGILQNLLSSDRFVTDPRIVSIDMGIRNLGICVLEAPSLNGGSNSSRSQQDFAMPTQLKVIAWKKVDVLGRLSRNAPATAPTKKKGTTIDASVFAPALMSKTARSITQEVLSTYHPTHILIERQRFRSGGASAVQEWTLRVNMLESMIWASLETLRFAEGSNDRPKAGSAGSFPEAFEINPARVANFWCGDKGETSTVISESLFETTVGPKPSPQGRRKIDKKDKIVLVRSWLDASQSTPPRARDVHLDLTPEVQEIAQTFTSVTGKERRRSSQDSGGLTKLDDLADCLLQGAGWVRWQENRRRLSNLLQICDTGNR